MNSFVKHEIDSPQGTWVLSAHQGDEAWTLVDPAGEHAGLHDTEDVAATYVAEHSCTPTQEANDAASANR